MEIDYTKLTRNYRENPIKAGEQLIYEDFYYLYWELNLTKQQVAHILGCGTNRIYKFAKEHNLVKNRKMSTLSMKNSIREKYGVNNVMQVNQIKQKLTESIQQTFKERGKQIVEQRKQTCIKNWGCENPSQVEEIKNKKRDTLLKNYGVENPQYSKEIQEKIKDTVKEKYGGFPFEVQSTSNQKLKDTMLDMYGCENAMQNKDIAKQVGQTQQKKQEEYKQKNLEKYGVEYPSQLPEIIDKVNNTKSKNGTFNTSSEELHILDLLKERFPNVVYNKTHKPLYPTRCDFYIPEKDLYIEYNGTWTHGDRPFDPEDEFCQKELAIMKEKTKTSQFYENAIYTWTVRDVQKREIAKKNNLNWIEFFNMDEFLEWYNEEKA